ncbi:hypothetical protein F2P81_004298 [Scophthalmus maximus]|uniref:Uncharacterized protein n=1 Tax=Scophthalmus maximus TaxID=52904 RepID=A0A6A4TJB4_SCOMX|nr:hypothetical protein F2P81_004298 [Scophthalmus maximus]
MSKVALGSVPSTEQGPEEEERKGTPAVIVNNLERSRTLAGVKKTMALRIHLCHSVSSFSGLKPRRTPGAFVLRAQRPLSPVMIHCLRLAHIGPLKGCYAERLLCCRCTVSRSLANVTSEPSPRLNTVSVPLLGCKQARAMEDTRVGRECEEQSETRYQKERERERESTRRKQGSTDRGRGF